MEVIETKLDGVVVLLPKRFGDNRGFFEETWNHRLLNELGIKFEFVQDNRSLSRDTGTVRGLHLQTPPQAQAKLVRCGRGSLFDVAVDVRKGSPTFGKWVGEVLSFENRRQLLIPAGFLHGFCTLEPSTEIIYKCSDYFAPNLEASVRYNDPDIAIEWPPEGLNLTLSDKDSKAPLLRDFESPFIYKAQ